MDARSGYTRRRDPDASLAAALASKIEDGNLEAAIRILSSDEKLAEFSSEATSQLQAKHPAAHPDRKPFQDPSNFTTLSVTEDQVWKALRSFPAGSSGGPDGFRPQHLVNLASCREGGRELVTNLTAFVNLLLEGRCPPRVANILFGGKLLALNKKDGGVRPIAVGYYWRRLAAKCANAHAIKRLGDYFGCLQVGVGVKGGCEAAIHAARRFMSVLSENQVLVKLDFRSAFNSIHRDALLECVASRLPELYRFCYLAYGNSTSVQFGCELIQSAEGVQQGDPLGPLLFCLVIHPILSSSTSPFRIGYMDDVTISAATLQWWQGMCRQFHPRASQLVWI